MDLGVAYFTQNPPSLMDKDNMRRTLKDAYRDVPWNFPVISRIVTALRHQ